MFHTIRELVCNELSYSFRDVHLIESSFNETSRGGKIIRLVRVGLTSRCLIIASKLSSNKTKQTGKDEFQLSSLYPLECVALTVFKCTKRQALKACLSDNNARYFEPVEGSKKTIFWDVWCMHVSELNNKQTKKWPFSICNYWPKITKNTDAVDKPKWTDSHLYLGAQRQSEDSKRPTPVAGLGSPDDVKQYLMPTEYKEPGQSVASEHGACEYDAFTYSGGPTCNVVYTSYLGKEKRQRSN